MLDKQKGSAKTIHIEGQEDYAVNEFLKALCGHVRKDTWVLWQARRIAIICDIYQVTSLKHAVIAESIRTLHACELFQAF